MPSSARRGGSTRTQLTDPSALPGRSTASGKTSPELVACDHCLSSYQGGENRDVEDYERTTRDVLERFDALWDERMTLGRLPAVLLADSLAATAAEVLDADGVGITVLAGTGLRVPIGASDPVASAAERLQFTVGDGPCFQVFDDQHTALFNGSALGEQFSTFYEGLTRHTPFRSIVATPLGTLRPWGMLDAYHRSSQPNDDGPSVRAIGHRVTAVLTETSAVAEAIGNRPDPDYKAPWDDRMHVWQPPA